MQQGSIGEAAALRPQGSRQGKAEPHGKAATADKTTEIAEEGEAEAPCHAALRKSHRMSKPSVKAAAMLPNVRYAAASVLAP